MEKKTENMEPNPVDFVTVKEANSKTKKVQETYGYLNLERFGLLNKKLNDVILGICKENPENLHPTAAYKISPKILEMVFKDNVSRESAVENGFHIFSQLVQIDRPRPLKHSKTIYVYGISTDEKEEKIRNFFRENLKLEISSQIRTLFFPMTKVKNGGLSMIVEYEPSVHIPPYIFYPNEDNELEKVILWYPDMPKYCRSCNGQGHLARDCQSINKDSRDKRSYSNAVARGPREKPTLSANNDDNIIQMEILPNPMLKIDSTKDTHNTIQKVENQYVAFYTKSDIFSNFYECKFDIGGVTYDSTEQYLFSEKALHVGDEENSERIKRNKEARICKAIGEKDVKWIETLAEWRDFAREKLKIANLAKYSQNMKLRKFLFETNPKTLVEANPFDSYWGIGLKKSDRDVYDITKWKGKNIMGFLLMGVREELLKDPEMKIVERKRSLCGYSPEIQQRPKRSSVSST